MKKEDIIWNIAYAFSLLIAACIVVAILATWVGGW